MALTNFPLSIAAVKTFTWSIAKKSDHLNRFSSETDPCDK